MKKEIQKFDRFIKKLTDGELTAFDETIEIFVDLINPEISAGQQSLMDRMGEYVEFGSIEEVQAFFDTYFGYQNRVIGHMESSLMLPDEKEFEAFLDEWAENLLETIPKEDRETDVIDSVYILQESMVEMFDIDLMTNPEKSRNELLRAFGSDEIADMFTFIIVATYEMEESKQIDEDELRYLVKLILSFVLAMNEMRKQRYEKRQNQKRVQESFGGAVNQTSYKVGRNDPCPCGSGKKYKKCCLNKPKAPLEAIKPLEPALPHGPLTEREVTEFYAAWSRFVAFVGNEFCDMYNYRYQSIYEKDSKGKFLLKEWAVKDGYYLELREFLVDNFHSLIDNYISRKRVGVKSVKILNEIKTRHLYSDFYAIEKFSSGNAIFYDPKDDRCYYVYKGYDKLERLLAPDNTLFQALLLSYRGRIICDGALGHYGVNMGSGMQDLLVESYQKAREDLRFDLDEVKEAERKIYQLKISIKGAKPPVWRRVLLESSSSFYALHNIIQTLFGWMDCHLHEFEASGGRYTDAESVEESFSWGERAKDESLFSIEHELVNEGDRIEYVYDFGDDWRHTIVLEKILPFDEDKRYPVCTGGRGDSFGEDSGGVYQFNADESWIGREPFDKKRINAMLGVVE